MNIIIDKKLTEFQFWGGAVDVANKLSFLEMERIEKYLEDGLNRPIGEIELNDFFWHESDFICQILGITEEDLYRR